MYTEVQFPSEHVLSLSTETLIDLPLTARMYFSLLTDLLMKGKLFTPHGLTVVALPKIPLYFHCKL